MRRSLKKHQNLEISECGKFIAVRFAEPLMNPINTCIRLSTRL